MDDNSEEDRDYVSVTVKLSGEYDAVVGHLDTADGERPALDEVMKDFAHLLDTVEGIEGGTKSVIVEHLPNDMARAYDTDAVVNALKVLEQYDYVTLDGNTWRPTK